MILFKFLFYFSIIISESSFAKPGWTPSSLRKEVVKLVDSFGSCTGTRVSRNGHILTARHCFNACIISQKIAHENLIYPEDGWRSPILYQMDYKNEYFCEVTIDGVLSRVKLIGGSQGFMTPMEQSSLSLMDKSLYSDFLNLNYFYNGDFLIIKEEVEAPTACATLSRETVHVGEYLYYDGYPAQTTGRPEKGNSDGFSMQHSEGKRSKTIVDNSCIHQYLDAKDLIYKYNRENIILSDLDVVPGASGSALRNQKGEIVGLINSVYGPGVDIHKQYCSDSVVSVSSDFIIKTLKNQVGEIQEIFDCF
jgi:hypothetical protein